MSEGFPSERELIVIAKTDVGLRAKPATEERVASFVGADVTPLSELGPKISPCNLCSLSAKRGC